MRLSYLYPSAGISRKKLVHFFTEFYMAFSLDIEKLPPGGHDNNEEDEEDVCTIIT